MPGRAEGDVSSMQAIHYAAVIVDELMCHQEGSENWVHQQNRSVAVALGANLRLLIVFRKLLWGCVAGSSPGVLGCWGAGRGWYLVLWYCRYLVTPNLKSESGM